MIDVKQAFKVARTSLEDLFADTAYEDVRLEEVEYNEGRGRWMITLSFFDPEYRQNSQLKPWFMQGGADAHIKGARLYKVFEVDAEEGTVHSVKMRAFADVG